VAVFRVIRDQVNPTVAVVIVNFNSGAHLASALAALPGGLAGVPSEVVVVDNGSSDGSERAALDASGVGVRLLRQGNVGFGAGVNTGIAHTSAPFVLVLNPDCRVQPDTVPRLLLEMERQPACAIIGPRILDPGGELQESARGDPNLFTGLFGRTSLLGRVFPSLTVVRRNLASDASLEPGQSSRTVDWVSGACMLARREALEAAGGFDERYFLYWEDADLCRRLRAAGWTTRYLPGAVVVHDVGQSSRHARRLANREFHRSAYRYYATHVTPHPWHPGRPVAWVILNVRSAIKQLAIALRPETGSTTKSV
jgi:N-acetylglucosaminyl-diphospho-decaprenol L-rhamnosyltransferase